MEKGVLGLLFYLYVKRGPFEGFFFFFFVDLVQYLNLSSKTFIPKKG